MKTLLPMSAHLRLAYALALGAIAALITAAFTDLSWAVLVGLTGVALTFVVLSWAVVWPMDTRETAKHAVRDSYNPLFEEVLIAAAAVISLVGMVMVMILSHDGRGPLAAAVGLIGVFLAWAMLHLMYATQYAHLYFDGEQVGGLDFGQDKDPCYADFLYFSFMVGMTYGTTDVGVLTTPLRSVCLRHGLLSFVFGTVILATGVSLVSGIFT